MRFVACLVASGSLLFGAPVHAQYLNTLAATPLSHFNEADTKLFMAAIDKALAEGVDGAPLAWKNERTPASGVVTPQKSHVADGMKCRDLLIATAYKTLKNEAVHTFCQTGGQWKLLQ